MTHYDWIQILVTLIPILILTPLLGTFMGKVFEGEKNFLSFFGKPLEKAIYKISGIHEKSLMDWKEYSGAVLIFNIIGLLFLFSIQIFQNFLPLNPQKLPNVPWILALNTAISFVTNTNWQSYSGENTLSIFTQMIGLTVQNFLSAATGISVLLALTRGLRNSSTKFLGNFWVDTTRSVVYIFLPLCFLFSMILVSQGVIQNFSKNLSATTVEKVEQILPMGPAASQIAIKQLGSNGGGYFNANSSHPYENPTPLSNLLETIALLLIPAALCFTFGRMVGNQKHGRILFLTMFLLLLGGLGISLYSEFHAAASFPVPYMEGKETRFGITNSVLWSVLTTASSNGSVNSMHSSLTPLAGGIAMLNIMLGEIIFGGVGSGLYGMILFTILTVFLAGLMVGRTPEYLGKKIEANEIQWVITALIVPNLLILVFSGISSVLPVALSSLSSSGPHGLSEILYAFSSATGNNGSAFAGLNANTDFYNLALGFCMLVGRFVVIIPCLKIAGSFAEKKITPATFGTFTTDNLLFLILLIGVILVVGALTFFPALALGPIMEHFLIKENI